MAFTNAWAITSNPAGTDDANTNDDALRKLRLDLRERLQFLGYFLGTDLLPADPTSKRAHYHWSEFHWNIETGLSVVAPNLNLGTSAGVNIYTPILLPRGASISQIEAQANLSTSSTGNLRLRYIDDALSITTIVSAALGVGQATYSAVVDPEHVIDDLDGRRFYYLELDVTVSVTTGSVFQGAQIVYTPPARLW